MKREEFIKKFEELREKTTLDSNCSDINTSIGSESPVLFAHVFSSITALGNEKGKKYSRLNKRGLYWLDHGLNSMEILRKEDQDTQRVIAFELFYHYVLSEKLYKEF